MPSTDAPTHYERSKYILPSRADDFLKFIEEDWYEAVTGSVESPVGWVGLVHVDRDLIARWVAFAGDPWMSEARNFSPGWYIVRIDDNGLVFGIDYGGEETLAEENARADFDEADRTYMEWLEEPAFHGDEDGDEEATEPEGEKMYLVCDCGEVFDEIATAYAHNCPSAGTPEYAILPESEAF